MDDKNKLLTALHNSLNYYSQIGKAFVDLRNARDQLQISIQNSRKNNTQTGAIVGVALLSVLFMIIIPFALNSKFGDSFLSTKMLQSMGMIASGVIAVIVLPKAFRKEKDRRNNAIESWQVRVNQIEEYIFNYYLNFCDSGFQVMPYVYCNPDTIRQFIFYIESCRADTLKEAVNCYVSDENTAMARHYQLLTLSAAQQSVIEARKGKNAATVAAVASILSNFK